MLEDFMLMEFPGAFEQAQRPDVARFVIDTN
jgi:hypothetical protein